MKTIYLQLETTGRYLFREPVDSIDQPHLARLAWVITDRDGHVTTQFCKLIKPPASWVYEDGAIAAHGITPAMATAMGEPQGHVVNALVGALEGVERVCAFNVDFVRKAIEHAAWENGLNWEYMFTEHIMDCAMRRATDIVQIPRMTPGAGPTNYAWPKFAEAYAFFSGEEMPPLTMNPVLRGVALCRCVMVIDQGIQQHRSNP
jgi:hypothetical protein